VLPFPYSELNLKKTKTKQHTFPTQTGPFEAVQHFSFKIDALEIPEKDLHRMVKRGFHFHEQGPAQPFNWRSPKAGILLQMALVGARPARGGLPELRRWLTRQSLESHKKATSPSAPRERESMEQSASDFNQQLCFT